MTKLTLFDLNSSKKLVEELNPKELRSIHGGGDLEYAPEDRREERHYYDIDEEDDCSEGELTPYDKDCD